MMHKIFLWMGLVACFLYLLSEFIDAIKRPENDFSFGKKRR
jgi:hypothetical protein